MPAHPPSPELLAPTNLPAPLAWAVQYLPEYFADPPCAFHVELLETLARANARLIARIAPRGHAKSTCATLAYPLWCVCEQRRRNVVIVTYAAPLATQFVRDIRDELENNACILAAYGDLCHAEPDDAPGSANGPQRRAQSGSARAEPTPRPKRRRRCWGAGRFTTTTGITVQAKGGGAAFRGLRVGPHRPDLVICDDIEKDEQVASAERRQKLEDWLRKVVMPALAPDGQLVVLGSLLHWDSLLASLCDRQRWPHWDYRLYRALEAEPLADGTFRKIALWPARWPVERLELERERIGTIAFEQEYQANPIDDAARAFRPEWLRPYAPSELVPERLVNLMAVDPATGRAGGDYFAVWIGSLDSSTNTIYTRRLTLERIGFPEQVARIMTLFEEWRPARIGIETNAYQIALKQSLDDTSRRLGLYLPIVELPAAKKKEWRVLASTPFYENGTFRLPAGLAPEVERQFLHFPKGGNDDAPDVCAMGIEVAREFFRAVRIEGVVARGTGRGARAEW